MSLGCFTRAVRLRGASRDDEGAQVCDGHRVRQLVRVNGDTGDFVNMSDELEAGQRIPSAIFEIVAQRNCLSVCLKNFGYESEECLVIHGAHSRVDVRPHVAAHSRVVNMPTRTLSASIIAAELDAPLLGDDVAITRPAPLAEASRGELTFVLNPDSHADAAERALGAGAVLLAPHGYEHPRSSAGAVVLVDNPRAAFATILARHFTRRPQPGIASTAVVHPTAVVAASASIGEFTVIREGAVIDADVEIRDHVVIGHDVRIGASSLVKSHAVVGEEGFGMERDSAGDYMRIPHIGSVVIAENVEIGAFATVCSGTIAPTRIADHTKLDDHVHIAHNCQIGRNVIITAGVIFSGSVTVEDDAWIGPNASIIQGVTLERGSLLGIGAVALTSVPALEVRSGNPARRLRSVTESDR